MHLPSPLGQGCSTQRAATGSRALPAPAAGAFQWDTAIFRTEPLVPKGKNNSSPNVILNGKSLKKCFSLGVKKEIEECGEEGKRIGKIIWAVRPGVNFACGNGGSMLRQRLLPLGVGDVAPRCRGRTQNRAYSSRLQSSLYLSAVIPTSSGNNLPCVEMPEKSRFGICIS